MSTASRVSIALVVVGALVWAASSFGTTKSEQSSGQPKRSTQSVLDADSDGSSQLAGRYHLRKRTSRFFRRSAPQIRTRRRTASVEAPDSSLAGRYHLRGRTARFFGRIG